MYYNENNPDRNEYFFILVYMTKESLNENHVEKHISFCLHSPSLHLFDVASSGTNIVTVYTDVASTMVVVWSGTLKGAKLW